MHNVETAYASPCGSTITQDPIHFYRHTLVKYCTTLLQWYMMLCLSLNKVF